MEKVKGYKGFNKDLTCREKQYKENTEFTEDVKPVACSQGMHFCKMPLDVFNYYPPIVGSEYAEVESLGDIVEENDKVATNRLKIKSKISVFQLFKAHFDIVFNGVKKSKTTTNTVGYKAHANTAGDEAHANTAGNYAHANTAGNYAHANTVGYKAHANTAGDEAHANTAGNYAHANTAGNYAHANTVGYKAHANTAGDEAIACSLGIESRSKASKGWIILVDWRQDDDYNWYIKNIYRAKVGKHKIQGTLIEPDTWYWFENGILQTQKL